MLLLKVWVTPVRRQLQTHEARIIIKDLMCICSYLLTEVHKDIPQVVMSPTNLASFSGK